MRRFYVHTSDIQGTEAIISGDEAHHMLHVLRLISGDNINLYDGSGTIYEATITSTTRNEVHLSINTTFQYEETPPFLHLGIALLTGKKMEHVLQKTTELGVKSIQPFKSRFITSKNISRNKIQRWQKISGEACKQCGRSFIPEIKSLDTFDNIISRSDDYDLKVIFFENENKKSLSGIEKIIHEKRPSSVMIMIGPEGGFSDDEIRRANDEGFVTVGLGTFILRAETAAITAVSLLQYLLGKLEPDES